jgi:mono/diheme cytochrome c family protein
MRPPGLRPRFVLALTLLAASALHAGGWAVVTIEELPGHVVAGTPVTLQYVVRQHGVTLLDGLAGSLEARLGANVVRTPASAAAKKGRYTATITLPVAGQWTIDIDSGFLAKAGTTRIQLAAVNAGSAAPVLPEVSRGQQLFAAKGCVTCHTHPEIAPLPSGLTLNGPRLGVRKYQPDFLRTFLANPPAVRLSSGEWRMPNLDLDEEEIVSLAAFLTSKRSAVEAASLATGRFRLQPARQQQEHHEEDERAEEVR